MSGLLTVLFFSFFSGCVLSGAPTTGPEQDPGISQENRAPGEYLIGFKGKPDEAFLREVLAPSGIEVLKQKKKLIFFIKLKNDPGPETIENLLKENPQIDYVEPNFIYHTQGLKK